MPEISTTAESYKRSEGRITKANIEQGNVPSNGGSLRDWMRRHEIPELRDMQVTYREIARRFYPRVQAGHPISEGEARANDAKAAPTDVWPQGESVEDFIAAAMEGRYEEEEDEPDF